MRVASIATTLLFVAVVVGCGEEEGDRAPTVTPQPTVSATRLGATPTASPSPTASPALTPTSRATPSAAESEEIVRAMALRAEDIPEGLTLTSEEFLREGLPPGAILAYERWYDVAVAPPAGSMATIYNQVMLVESTDVGRIAVMAFTDAPPLEALARAMAPEGSADMKIESLPFPTIGDGSAAAQVTVDLAPTLKLVGRAVAFNRGRGVGFVAVWALELPPPLEDVEALVRALDRRIQAALE